MENLGIIYKGANTDDLFFSTYSLNAWSNNRRIATQNGAIDPKSNRSPALCLLNNLLYFVYKGHDNNSLYLSSFDGDVWSGNTRVSELPGDIDPLTDYDPTTVYFNRRMYVIYKGHNSTNLYWASFDGVKWHGNAKIEISSNGRTWAPRTNHSVDAAVFDKKLWILYQGVEGNNIYWMNFDGESWSGDERISSSPGGIDPRTEGSNPGLVSYEGKLYAFYKGAGDNDIFYLTFDKESWAGNERLPGINPKTTQAPRAIIFKKNLWIVFKGQGTNALYTATYNGTSWSGNSPILVGSETVSSDSCPEFCLMPNSASDMAAWLQGIPDAQSIGRISLPGTHDSAAISTWKTPYACHNTAITRQFASGVRAFDIRIQIAWSQNDGFTFMTCHGSAGLFSNVNVYQSLESAFDELEVCVTDSDTEFVAVLLRVDDNQINKGQAHDAMKALKKLIDGYPLASFYSSGGGFPSLREVRGKIYLLNGFNPKFFGEVEGFGPSVLWDDDTSGQLLTIKWNPVVTAYVQDHWFWIRPFPTAPKEEEFRDAIVAAKEKKADLFLNFATGSAALFGIYIQPLLLSSFGSLPSNQRPVSLGWSFFDYENRSYNLSIGTTTNIVKYIVNSNFGYNGFPDIFTVLGDGKDEI